jgi:hypothetical protein
MSSPSKKKKKHVADMTEEEAAADIFKRRGLRYITIFS